jgi:nitroreductase
METWEAITTRRNVREFSPEPLAPEHLERILEAAWRSPSSQNSQPWDFVVVTERSELEELSKVWRGGAHIAGAAAAVVLVIDDEPDQRLRETARYDIGQASMQMMIAAIDVGVVSGHSSVGEFDLAKQLLGLPDGKLARYIIDFGYPAGGKSLKPIRKPDRRAFDEVVHRGSW